MIKKLLLLVALVATSVLTAQINITYEDGTTITTLGSNGGSTLNEVITNDVTSGINTSAKCGRITQTVGAQNWDFPLWYSAGSEGFNLNETTGYFISFKVLSKVQTTFTVNVIIRHWDDDSGSNVDETVSQIVTVPALNEWTEIEFDFSDAVYNGWCTRLAIQFNPAQNPREGDIYYVDDIVQNTTAQLEPVEEPDSWSFDNHGADLPQNTSVDIPITYTSDLPVQVGGIKWEMVCVSGNPWSQNQWMTFKNNEVLPAGTDFSANITMSNFLGTVTTSGTTGGIIMTKAQLIAANPNNVDPAPTNYYFELRSRASEDSDFTPAALPSTYFLSFLDNPTASVEDEALRHIKIYPNPTSDFINISDLTDIETISIHNVLGKKIKTFKAEKTIDISELSTGIYFLQTNNGLKRKIVKQ